MEETMTIADWFSFAHYMLRPRALKWCLRMNSFDRICYSYDYLILGIKAHREKLFVECQ